MERHRAAVALLALAGLHMPPDEMKAAALPEKKAVVAIATLVDTRIVGIISLYTRTIKYYRYDSQDNSTGSEKGHLRMENGVPNMIGGVSL